MTIDPRTLEALDVVRNEIKRNATYYETAAKRAKQAFLHRTFWTRVLISFGVLLFTLAGLHAEKAIIELFRLEGNDALRWHAVAAAVALGGVFLGGIGGLLLQDTNRRGLRRAWLRYGVTLTELVGLLTSLSVDEILYKNDPMDRSAEAGAVAKEKLLAMQSLVRNETRQWAKDADRDFGDLLDNWAKQAETPPKHLTGNGGKHPQTPMTSDEVCRDNQSDHGNSPTTVAPLPPTARLPAED